jgi:hypothetical protein
VLNTELGEKFLAAMLAGLLAEFSRLEYGHDVLMDGELSKNRFLLWQVAHTFARAAIHCHAGNVAILENDAPAVGPDETDDHIKRGRLARAIGAEQADDFAALDVYVHAVDNGAASVNLYQFVSGKEGLVILRRGRGKGRWGWRDAHQSYS